MVFFWVLQRVTDQLDPQGLQFDLLDFLLLQRHSEGLLHIFGKLSNAFIELSHMLAHLHLFFERLIELKHIEIRHQHEVVHGGFF